MDRSTNVIVNHYFIAVSRSACLQDGKCGRILFGFVRFNKVDKKRKDRKKN